MDIKEMAAREARKQGIPENIFFGLIQAESSWNPSAVSHAGAMGLTQVMPGTARGMGYDPDVLRRNPSVQLEAGAKYLSQMYNQFGNWELALAAYNAGPGNVQKYGGIPPFEETQNYVPRVMKFAREMGGGNIPEFTPGTAVPRSTIHESHQKTRLPGPTVDLASLLSNVRTESPSESLTMFSPTSIGRRDDSGLPMPTVPLTQPKQPLIPDESKAGAPGTGVRPEKKDALDAVSEAAKKAKDDKPAPSPYFKEQKDFAKEEPENIRRNWQSWIGGLLRGDR